MTIFVIREYYLDEKTKDEVKFFFSFKKTLIRSKDQNGM